MIHNEVSRVKIPAILHLTRLGYTYLSLKNTKWDPYTNILTDIFQKAIHRLNHSIDENDIDRIYSEISLTLENEDLELENQKLSEIRDWILPMLMNGQVTVGEAEEESNRTVKITEKQDV
jgi:type I site-specific restriction-modification system R (restriction) subunit